MNIPKKKFNRRFLQWQKPIVKTLIYSGIIGGTMAAASVARSAEEVYINYGLFEVSLSVDALETFAEEGEITGDLATYADYIGSQRLQQLKFALDAEAGLSPVAVSNFLYTLQGEVLLERLSEIIQTPANQSGFYGLRAALVLAAADEEEGLTLLNVIKKFPFESIQINSSQGFRIVDELQQIVRQTDQVISVVQKEAEAEEQNEEVNLSSLVDLKRPGDVSFRKITLTLDDTRRERDFPVDLYLPQQQGLAPLIVISHGLGSDRNTYAYLAEHLASHGYAVAVPEHPGSNTSQIDALIRGRTEQVSPPSEFIDRPLDISFVLDYLEAYYTDQIQLNDVGIIGQSYGGYTALAVAGAEINWQNLASSCSNLSRTYNLSLLLQCAALALPQIDYDLSDPRIGAAIAINPLTSGIFGEAGLDNINIPVMIVSGSADTVTPPLSEQIRPFTWLTTQEKYLVLLQGGTHFSTLDESNNSRSIPLPSEVIGPEPIIAQNYLEALSLAFYNAYVTEQPQYLSYLSATYAESISQPVIPLNLVRSLAQEQLN